MWRKGGYGFESDSLGRKLAKVGLLFQDEFSRLNTAKVNIFFFKISKMFKIVRNFQKKIGILADF